MIWADIHGTLTFLPSKERKSRWNRGTASLEFCIASEVWMPNHIELRSAGASETKF